MRSDVDARSGALRCSGARSGALASVPARSGALRPSSSMPTGHRIGFRGPVSHADGISEGRWCPR